MSLAIPVVVLIVALVLAIGQNIAILDGASQFRLSIAKGTTLLLFGLLSHIYYYVIDLLFAMRRGQP